MSARQMIEEMIYDAVKSGDGPDSAMRIVDMFRALADEIDKAHAVDVVCATGVTVPGLATQLALQSPSPSEAPLPTHETPPVG